MKNGIRTKAAFAVLAAVILTLLIADILLGSIYIPLKDIFAAFGWGSSHSGPGGLEPGVVRSIVADIRLPRAIVAVVGGASLAASGLQMQTLFRNPLAGPYVLGVSSGASLGVALFLLGVPLFGLSSGAEIIRNLGVAGAAWIGAAAILLMIMAASARLKDIMTILILGMMVGSAAGALVELLQYLSPEGPLKSYVIWTMGSVGNVTGPQLAILIPVCAAGLVMSVLLIKPLNLLLLGENYARTMGLRIPAVRGMIFLSTTLLAGTVTAYCGPIGFVGIAVPHIARMIFSDADHKILMPASIMAGAAMLLLCDIISQMPGYGMTLPINVVTALLGIPIVITVIVRNRKIL
ncbi:MAG: iron ABC transporter permease [Rikenellaceae bacterium]|nr:iron ABC transporter permease [Rikenellaceae bacterium]